MTHPARVAVQHDDVEPLTADLRRLHITVSRRFLQKVAASRDGLSHTIPGATIEQALEAALDLLLEKQARARGLVKRPRSALAAVATPAVATRSEAGVRGEPSAATEATLAGPAAGLEPAPGEDAHAITTGRQQETEPRSPHEPAPPLALLPTEPDPTTPPTTEPPPPRRTGPREAIPAAVRRAVWERDGGRCSWPLDGGGCCGSTHRLELDHVIPWAREGGPTVANLRLVCQAHNALAARQSFGARWMARYQAGRRMT